MSAEATRLAEVEQTAARFAARHLAPAAADVDHADPAFPAAVFALGLEAGFDRFMLPESAGGYGFTLAELGALVAVLARTCAGHAAVFGVHAAIVAAMHEAGGPAAELLTRVFSSGWPLAVAIPEPLSPHDFETEVAIDARRSATGRAGLAINAAPHGFAVAFAKDENKTPLAFLAPADQSGVVVGPAEFTLGLRAMPLAELSFADWPLPAEQVIGAGDAALAFYRTLLRYLAYTVSAAALGTMQAARRQALAYMAQRYQGGRMIIDHSHLRQILGAMTAAEIAAAGALAQAAARPDWFTALGVKAFATDAAARLAADAVQLLGGYGYMREYGLEKRLRDAATLALLPISNPRAELLLAAMEKETLS
ncbi:MAG: acyl-CoA/acyl-ACP dehydrogenase [Myxococcales bacterium]|nr:acyl-CoA/acyl-ACP dehydrogenase [Myxococcales bacterium]